MSTMGLRGILAATFILSTGLLNGMMAMPSGPSASQRGPAGPAAASESAPGLLDRFMRRACEISLAASHRDRSGSRKRSQECEQ